MKKTIAIALLIICTYYKLFAQIDNKLKEDIRNVGYVHRPLPLDYSKSFESFGLTKKVVAPKCCVICKASPNGHIKDLEECGFGDAPAARWHSLIAEF